MTNKLKQQVEDEEKEDAEAIKAELEKAQLEMKKMKAKESVELNRLKEVIRRQERSINALKNSRSSGNEASNDGGGGVSKTKSKSPAVGESSRQALGDRSSHQNTQLSQKQIGKTASSKNQSEVKVIDENVLPTREVDNEEDDDTLTEEPTEHWLQRHLAKLNNANNQLGVKMMDNHDNNTDDIDSTQRKPYNAADYDANQDGNSIPQVVTALSPSMQHVEGGGELGDNGRPQYQQQVAGTQSRSQTITQYKNGTQKEVMSDGTTTISFANGDRKRTYANEKKGIVVYYYAATKVRRRKTGWYHVFIWSNISDHLTSLSLLFTPIIRQTTQVTHIDGMQTYHFPNKQIENHYTDGRKEITFPDGTNRMVHTDGTTETLFVDGTKEITFPDGSQQIIKA